MDISAEEGEVTSGVSPGPGSAQPGGSAEDMDPDGNSGSFEGIDVETEFEEGSNTEEKSVQSKADRARFAAARRKAEFEKAVSRARREEQEASKNKWNGFFADAGLKNPLDGNKPIKSMEDYSAYKAQYNTRVMQRNLREGKLTPQDLEKALSETETMKKARQIIERAESAEKKVKEAQFKEKTMKNSGK